MRKFLLVLLVVSLFAGVAKAVDSLDATVPANKSLISTFAGYERETRAKVNEIIENIPDIANWEVVTVAHTAAAGEKLLVNTSAAACTVTLPATPEAGSFIYLADAKGTWPTYNVTLARNGNMIAGAAANYTLATSGIYFLMYVDAGYGWAVTSAGGSSSELSGSLRALSGFGYTDFADVIADIGSDPVLLLIDEDMTLSTSASIPATLRLLNTHGNLITLGAGKTLTFVDPSQILSGYQQIFTGTGTVTFTKPGVVHPDWWQANTSGTTGMGAAINKAIESAAAGSTIQFGSATYLLTSDNIRKCEDLAACNEVNYLKNYFVNIKDGLTIKGEGWSSIIKVADHIYDQPNDDTSNAHVFQGFDIENVVIRDMQIDMNGYNNLSPSGKTRNVMAVRLDDGGSNVLIENLYILNNPGHNNIVANYTSGATKGNGLTVTDCVMYGGGTGILGNNYNIDFSFIYSEWNNTIVSGNRIEQPEPTYTWSGGIELHGSNSKATNNIILYCDPAVWIASAQRGGGAVLLNVEVTDNIMENCSTGVRFWNSGEIKNVTIANNVIRSMWRGGADKYIYGIQMIGRTGGDWTDATAAGAPNYNINIIGNVITGEDDDTRYGMGFGVPAGIALTSTHGAKIEGNIFAELMGAGILVSGSPYGVSDVMIQNNYFKNWGRGHSGYGTSAIQVDVTGGPAASWDETEYVPDAGEFKIRNMVIEGNFFEKEDNSTRYDDVKLDSYCYSFLGDTQYNPGDIIGVVIRNNIDNVADDTTRRLDRIGGNLGGRHGYPWGINYHNPVEFTAITSPDSTDPLFQATGYHYRGEVAWNLHPGVVGVGQPIGWVCTTEGEPGTWTPFGYISKVPLTSGGTFSQRPDWTTLGNGYMATFLCTDCEDCRWWSDNGTDQLSSGPTPIWYAWWTGNETTSTEGKWYCFNGVEVTEP